MALFKVVVEAFVASRELDQASLSRLGFWCDELGEKEIAAINADDKSAENGAKASAEHFAYYWLALAHAAKPR